MSGGSAKSCRHAFTEALLEAARADRSIMAVTSDAKGSVTLGDFEKALPEQFLEMGIAEQNTVGVSAGLPAPERDHSCAGRHASTPLAPSSR